MPKKKEPSEQVSEKITTRVKPKTFELLKEIAEASGGNLTMSKLVRMFIKEGLEKRGLH